MGNKQSSVSRTHSRSKSTTALPNAQTTDAQTPRFTVRDESLVTEEPPPAYTRHASSSPMQATAQTRQTHSQHGQYLTVTSDALLAQLQRSAGQDLRRSSSSASQRTPAERLAGHRRTASHADSAARRDGLRVTGGAEQGRVDLAAIGADLIFLQHALASGSSGPAPRRVSRTPSPRPRTPVDMAATPTDTLSARTPRSSRPQSSQTLTVTDVPTVVPTISQRNGQEDPLVLLRKYDTIVVVDDSGSMLGERWSEARNALAELVDAASRYNVSGIRIHFLNDSYTCTVKNSADIGAAFAAVCPKGSTPTGEKLEEILLEYLDRLEASKRLSVSSATAAVKPINIIVLTDGAPSDDPESVIVATARRLDAQHFPISQVGIQFVQIGNEDEATAALRELDDELAKAHGVRDIVDTTSYSGTVTAELIAKALIGGINRRVDKRGL